MWYNLSNETFFRFKRSERVRNVGVRRVWGEESAGCGELGLRRVGGEESGGNNAEAKGYQKLRLS